MKKIKIFLAELIFLFIFCYLKACNTSNPWSIWWNSRKNVLNEEANFNFHNFRQTKKLTGRPVAQGTDHEAIPINWTLETSGDPISVLHMPFPTRFLVQRTSRLILSGPWRATHSSKVIVLSWNYFSDLNLIFLKLTYTQNLQNIRVSSRFCRPRSPTS